MKTKKGFKTLRARHKRSFYKSDTLYLQAIYRRNKEYIDTRMGEGYRVSHKTAFVNTVKEYMRDKHISPNIAVSKFISSEEFTTKGERLHYNLIKGLKENKEVYAAFKKNTNIKKKEDIDIDKLEYDINDQVYKYDDYIIDVSNSPQEVNIYEKNQYDNYKLGKPFKVNSIKKES